MNQPQRRQRAEPGVKLRGQAKVELIPVKIVTTGEILPKPAWIRTRLSNSPAVQKVKNLLRENKLHSVCEEAQCPNLSECFANGTATFMIMGDICTRRCPFCDVAHGRPLPLDEKEPQGLADAVGKLGLRHVVITSVDRDDLRDGGAAHFVNCIAALRAADEQLMIEVLVPDFRGRRDVAITIMATQIPDIFNHNLETVPRLYKEVRPGSDYLHSLELLGQFKVQCADVRTKSGLMLGVGETIEETMQVMIDLRKYNVDMLTLGQYLQPSRSHLPVKRYVHPDEFDALRLFGEEIGFAAVASGPMVRSSYHADVQAHALL